ncbi:hypothetical protein ACQ46_gp127 [Citrobacter phage Moon]|uniref:Uncharacterized protein n=1 Tax=Citrobacter phage Moon TaxID=1540095 RepID=A0A0A0YTI9_9CAUD|nr:hypothetical protein ACQ46_gp127 [Citrobacter phage Moon]AIX12098.1 hypothetical protein CPT_Moon127 [Citrobacter phage Moon]
MNDLIRALMKVEEECDAIILMSKFDTTTEFKDAADIRTFVVKALQKLVNEKVA